MRRVAIAVSSAAVLLPSFATGQFGIPQLPNHDFTWRWADAEDSTDTGVGLKAEDFQARGYEMAFSCVLTGALSPGSQITMRQLQEMEMTLVASISFIQASATAMNDLDFNRELGWAILDCKKAQARDEDPEKVEAEVERARQKAVEDMLKRRERAQREQ
jgi:hypothetical protein